MDSRKIPLYMIIAFPIIIVYCCSRNIYDQHKCESKPGQVFIRDTCIKGEEVKL